MKAALRALLFSVTGAADLKLSWSDCGDSDTHTKITGFSPTTASSGATTAMVGTAILDEDVSGANFDIELSTAVGRISCRGDASRSKSCPLPLDSGAIIFHALSFPIKRGASNVSVDLRLGNVFAWLPGIFLKTETLVSAVSSNGSKLFCMGISSVPASWDSEVHPGLLQTKQMDHFHSVASDEGGIDDLGSLDYHGLALASDPSAHRKWPDYSMAIIV